MAQGEGGEVAGFHCLHLRRGLGARRYNELEQVAAGMDAYKLYQLNDSTAATTPSSEGDHPWASFEDFNRSVRLPDWYRPHGQVVAIDTCRGNWAGMSAITRFEGASHTHNLFTA